MSQILEGCPRARNELGWPSSIKFRGVNTDDRPQRESVKIKGSFLKSAVFPADYPDAKKPEVVIVGRSNAGKSSFINKLTGTKIAKISREPGKTRLLNFFDMGEQYRLVDTPGYGFASRSGIEMLSWKEMLETYLATRGNFIGLLLMMDIRRDWSEDEETLLQFMNSVGRPVMVILTKADRLKDFDVKKRCETIQKQAHLEKVWSVSIRVRGSVEAVEKVFFTNWIKKMEGG